MAGIALGDITAVELLIERERTGRLLRHQRTGAQSVERSTGQSRLRRRTHRSGIDSSDAGCGGGNGAVNCRSGRRGRQCSAVIWYSCGGSGECLKNTLRISLENDDGLRPKSDAHGQSRCPPGCDRAISTSTMGGTHERGNDRDGDGIPAAQDPDEFQKPICEVGFGTKVGLDPAGEPAGETEPLFVIVPFFDAYHAAPSLNSTVDTASREVAPFTRGHLSARLGS